MPSTYSIILATLAAMATTAIAAPAPLPTFPTPWFSPDVEARTPGIPKFPPPFEGTWPEVNARSPIETTSPRTGLADVSFTVDCGCWTMCTLEKVIDKDLVCPSFCDPQFECAGPIARNTDAVELDNTAATKTKRNMEPLDKRGGTVSGTVTQSGGKLVYTATITINF
ncbi:hypothetical protein LTR17_027393 [Elasticomyces elasticus]|nr:hypothetical protein LTR17_027393 [Elasticomyces elasticus]